MSDEAASSFTTINVNFTHSGCKKDEPSNRIKYPKNSCLRPVESMTRKEIKKEKIMIWKDVTVISVSFMCLFTAYGSVANLQVFFK